MSRRRALLAIVVVLWLGCESAPADPGLPQVSPVPVSIRWMGSPPPQTYQVTFLDDRRAEVTSFQVQTALAAAPWAIPAATRYVRVSARHFRSVEVRRDRLAFGLSVDALARISFPADSEPNGNPVHVFARQRGGSETLSLLATAGAVAAVEIPPGEWVLLVDDRVGAPALLQGLQVAPGEERRIVRVDHPRKSTTRFRIVTADRKPAIGARITWKPLVMTDEALLLGAWLGERSLVTDKNGVSTADRLPPYPHTWVVEAEGFAPSVVKPDRTLRDELTVDVVLRDLPQLAISVLGAPFTGGPISLVLQRIPEQVGPGGVPLETTPPLARTVWSQTLRAGEVTGIVRLREGGLYRAIATSGVSVAANDIHVSLLDGPDKYNLNVSFRQRRIFGRVTVAEEPVPGAHVRLVPRDRVVTPGTLLLAAGTTGSDGGYELSASYPGDTYLEAELPNGDSKRQSIVGGDADEAEVNVHFRKGSLAIVVTDSHTGERIEGAQILFEFTPTGQHVRGTSSRLTDEHGRALIGDLEDGSMGMKVWAQGYAQVRLRDVTILADANPDLSVGLERATAFRVKVRDTAGNPKGGAEVLKLESPRQWNPRRAPLDLIGRTDGAGEFVLEELFGEPTPIFVICEGYVVQIGTLPSWGIADASPDANTLELVLWRYVPGVGLRVLGKAGDARSGALLLFTRDGIDVPISVLVRAAERNGLSVPNVLMADREGVLHAGDLLAPGQYLVSGLYPGVAGSTMPSDDRRDALGQIQLPLASDALLNWSEERPGFFPN